MEVNWRQLANIWNGSQGKALKDYLDDRLKSVMSEILAEAKGLDGLAKLLEARGKLSTLQGIMGDMEKADMIAENNEKHNEGSAEASSDNSDSG